MMTPTRTIEFAEELIDDLASGLSIDYEPVGRVGEPTEEILADAGAVAVALELGVDLGFAIRSGHGRDPDGVRLQRPLWQVDQQAD